MSWFPSGIRGYLLEDATIFEQDGVLPRERRVSPWEDAILLKRGIKFIPPRVSRVIPWEDATVLESGSEFILPGESRVSPWEDAIALE